MRSRPDVKLLVRPPVVVPGQPFEAEAVLVSRSPTPVDSVTVSLRATVRASSGGQVPMVFELLALEAVHRPGRLRKGENRLKTMFQIPPTLPPSYDGVWASISCRVHVDVDIPWWPDRSAVFAARCIGPRGPDATARPKVFLSHVGGPQPNQPFFEVSLDATTVPASGVIRGLVAVSNMGGFDVRGLSVALVTLERVQGFAHERSAPLFPLWGSAPPDAMPIAFTLQAPSAPTFQTSQFGVEYFLVFTLQASWSASHTCRIPLTVAPEHSRGIEESRQLHPIGSPRITQMLSMSIHGTPFSLAPGAHSVQGRFGSVVAHASLATRDGELVRVVDFDYPPLGVELRIFGRSLTDVLSDDIFEPATGRGRYSASGREQSQVERVVDHIVAQLEAFEHGDVQDHRAVAWERGGLHDEATVRGFLGRVAVMAETLDRARVAMPPPLFMDKPMLVENWKRAAATLGGRFEAGSMAIRDLRIHGMPCTIESRWKRPGLFVCTALEVLVAPPLEDGSLDGPRASAAARAIAANLRATTPTLRIEPHRIGAELASPTADPMTLLPFLEQMVQLARLLRGETSQGAYR